MKHFTIEFNEGTRKLPKQTIEVTVFTDHEKNKYKYQTLTFLGEDKISDLEGLEAVFTKVVLPFIQKCNDKTGT